MANREGRFLYRELQDIVLLRQWQKPRSAGAWAVVALGALLFIIGLTLAVGGAWLILVGGSWFYAFAGIALIVAGMAIAQQAMLGAWLYGGAFVLTAIWAFSEVALNGWALVPRLAGPSVLSLLVLLALPTLDPSERGRRRRLYGLVGFALLVVVFGFGVAKANRGPAPGAMPAPAAAMSDPSLMPVGADWPAYGGTYSAQRYSPLDLINRRNVGRLERAWTFRTGDLPEERYGAETTPLKIGGALYLCTGRNILIALSASTGKELWRYDPHVADRSIPYTAACRGVAYYAAPTAGPAQPCATRIIEGTLDARLIAVDAHTGKLCADFGDGGQVDTTLGMGETGPGVVSITSPPAIVRGVIVTGHQILDGQRRDSPSGVIQGYDALSGAFRWAWDLGRPGNTTQPPKGETFTRGTPNSWTIATGDEQLGLVYMPMGNSAADYWSRSRTPPENQYSTALVALDVTTGRPAWSFQTVHVDVWDYDLGSQPTFVDFPTASGVVPALILPTKQGDIYVLDRRTGAPLHGVEERAVPQGGLEPERRAATQPFSLYHTLRMPDLRESDMWGMSLIDQMACRIQFREATYDGIYTPPTSYTRWIQYPGYTGGSDWGGIAVDPRRGVIVASYNNLANYDRLVPRAEADRIGLRPRSPTGSDAEGMGDPQMGTPFAVDINRGWRLPFTGLLCTQPPYGSIRAIDLRTGRTLWERPLGTARRNGPFGIPSLLPIDIGTPNNGGAVVTAGGLIFIAAATNDLIRAIDIETGETVWQDVLPAGGQANPMVYEMNGRQYLVIMAGGHQAMGTPRGDYLIAYALPPA